MLALLFFSLALGTVLPLPVSAAPAPAAGPADADRDGLSEGLERRLDPLSPSERVDALVSLHGPATPDRLGELRRRAPGLRLGRRLEVSEAVAASLTRSEARALASMPDVARVEHDGPIRALDDSARESFGVTAAKAAVPHLDGDGDGRASEYSASDPVAAVVDTGIDEAHPDLDDGKVLASVDCTSGTCSVQPAGTDADGHGTHVAATLAGDGEGEPRYAGVAPGAGLVDVKAIDPGGVGTTSAAIAGIEWAVEHAEELGIEAINLSLAGDGCSDGRDALSRAADTAVEAGLVVVAAAGNSGPGTCTISAPGAAEDALTVANMADTEAGGFLLSPMSSRGPTADGRIKPDVAGPGVEITSAKANTSGYRERSGTSMAAPFVTGVALLMLDQAGDLRPEDLKETVMETAVDWGGRSDARPGASTRDIDYGGGRLDAFAALRAAGASGMGDPPRLPAHRALHGALEDGVERVDHRLEVDGVDPIAATLIAPAGDADGPGRALGLELRDPGGQLVASSKDDLRQDSLSHRPERRGAYTLSVVGGPGAGSFLLDVSAPLDETPPETEIAAGPPRVTRADRARFTLSAPDPEATFECSLDGAEFRACRSPVSYTGLGDGDHVLRARAGDRAGNLDRSPAIRTWRVDTRGPRITGVSPARGARGVARFARASVRFSEPVRPGILGRATLTLRRAGTPRAVPAALTAVDPHRLVLHPRRLLRRGARYIATVRGARDVAGNPLDTRPRVRGSQGASWRFTVRR